MRRASFPLLLLALSAPVSFSTLVAQSPPPAGAPAPPPAGYPTKDRWGKPLPSLTFYCQYLGLATDATAEELRAAFLVANLEFEAAFGARWAVKKPLAAGDVRGYLFVYAPCRPVLAS